MRELTINFPLYSDVKELYIGIEREAILEAPMDYLNKGKIVYYGSSITQGGCASRPGLSYESIVSRMYDCDYINLGFSGSAKAELEMAEYIKTLDMSLFVYDYDHNAPTLEYLAETHERMFNIIKQEHPKTPIIIMPKPDFYGREKESKEFEVIKKTYDNAIANGDKNVYLITGAELVAECGDNGTVDGSHPNDLGFYSMAKALCNVIDNNEIMIK